MKSVPGVIQLTVKWEDFESDLSPPFIAEVNMWNHDASPPSTIRYLDVVFKYGDNSVLSLEK
jgi:hypothetical protein